MFQREERRKQSSKLQPWNNNKESKQKRARIVRETSLLKRRQQTESRRSPERMQERIYIGLYSSEERKKLFLHYFGAGEESLPSLEETQRGPIHTMLPTFVENPYRPETWYTTQELRMLSQEQIGQIGMVVTKFNERYAVQNQLGRVETATAPELFSLTHTSDYFRHILDKQPGLFMKLVLLPDSPEDENGLREIYNEVIAAYFLNELVYGYTQVLSLHFMSVVDWFPTQRTDPFGNKLFYQVIVSERLEKNLVDYLYENPGLSPLRAVLFQYFHAMETVWYTNGGTHNDAHLGNLMMKPLTVESPLFDRDFLYRRLNDARWYRVPARAIKNHLLKVIDFGRFRMQVPDSPNHKELSPGGISRHRHARQICAPGFDFVGYPCDAPNRQIDVLLPLLGLIKMGSKYWMAMEAMERAAAYAFLGRMIPFDEMTASVDSFLWSNSDYPNIDKKQVEVEFARAGRRMNVSKFRASPQIIELVRTPGFFTYRYRDSGTTVTDALNDEFFQEYRTNQVLPDRSLTEEEVLGERDRHVVVSFVQHPEEAIQLELGASIGASIGASSTRSRCTVCGLSNSAKFGAAGDVRLCGKACYEFKYIFGGKTVFR